MYSNGIGAPLDNLQALKLCRRSADQSLSHAQYNLGLIYANGENVQQDYVLAHMWWSHAAASGHSQAKQYVDAISKLMKPEEISESERFIREWSEKN